MRALLFCLGQRAPMDLLQPFTPTPLLKVVDKPILIHILEYLSAQKIKRLDLLLHHHPEAIEAAVEDGKRWGIEIIFHLINKIDKPLLPLVSVRPQLSEKGLIIGCGDYLPIFPNNFFTTKITNPYLLLDHSKSWCCWGRWTKEQLAHIKSDDSIDVLIESSWLNPEKEIVSYLLSARTPEELLKSNQQVVGSGTSSLFFPSTAKMVESKVWVSRGVAIHPRVKIIPPVFLGEECQIKQNCSIGPFAIIEKRSIIDDDSSVEYSLVMNNSYVGQGVEISNSVVDRNVLINVEYNTTVAMQDELILGELRTPSLKRAWHRFLNRSLAFLLIILSSPLYLFLRLITPLQRETKVMLPALKEDGSYKTYTLYRFARDPNSYLSSWNNLPSLYNVFRGDLHFVGVTPMSLKEVELLPLYWRKLYLSSKGGVISLASLDYGYKATPDERYASDAFYVANMGTFFDLKIFFRYLLKKIRSLSFNFSSGK